MYKTHNSGLIVYINAVHSYSVHCFTVSFVRPFSSFTVIQLDWLLKLQAWHLFSYPQSLEIHTWAFFKHQHLALHSDYFFLCSNHHHILLLFSCTSVGLFFLSLSLSVQSIFLSFLKGTSVQLSNSPIHFIYFDQVSNLFIPFLKKHHCLLLFSTLHYSQTILFFISSSPVCGIIQDCICEVTFFFPKKIKKHVLTNGSTPYKPHLIIFSIISGYNKPIFVVSFSLSWCNKRIREWKQILCTCCILVLHQNL